MPLVGDLVSVRVTKVGSFAHVVMSNRTGSRKTFVLPTETVTLDGNTDALVVVPADGLTSITDGTGKVVWSD